MGGFHSQTLLTALDETSLELVATGLNLEIAPHARILDTLTPTVHVNGVLTVSSTSKRSSDASFATMTVQPATKFQLVTLAKTLPMRQISSASVDLQTAKLASGEMDFRVSHVPILALSVRVTLSAPSAWKMLN